MGCTTYANAHYKRILRKCTYETPQHFVGNPQQRFFIFGFIPRSAARLYTMHQDERFHVIDTAVPVISHIINIIITLRRRLRPQGRENSFLLFFFYQNLENSIWVRYILYCYYIPWPLSTTNRRCLSVSRSVRYSSTTLFVVTDNDRYKIYYFTI